MTHLLKAFLLGLSLLIALTGCAGLVIGGTAAAVSVAHDRRTAGTMVEDQSIELKVRGEFDKYAALSKRSHINITSYNNAVLLSGEVISPEWRQRAEDIARSVEKVKYVYNELIVAPPTSFSSRSADTLITAKIKTSLFQVNGIQDFDPTRVKVVTERGVVYLFGLLKPREAEIVTETVRHVGGVQKVVKLFEYIDEPLATAT